MRWVTASLVVAQLLCLPARSQEKESVILFLLTTQGDTASVTAQINSEMEKVLAGSGSFQLIPLDELADDLMMPPGESLAFCSGETECIADLGNSRNARWILFGGTQSSFDGKKVLVHLVKIDVAAKKVKDESYGQYDKEGQVATEAANQLRRLMGIGMPAPEPEIALDLAPDPEPVPVPKPEPETSLEPERQPESVATDVETMTSAEKPEPLAGVKAIAPEGPNPWTNPWTWTATGIGVAAVTSGIILGVLSARKEDDARTPGLDQPAAFGLVGEAKDLALGANIAYGVGGAALAAAVVLFILDLTGEEPGAAPSMACSGTGCVMGVSARF
jgi:hypothetical protein